MVQGEICRKNMLYLLCKKNVTLSTIEVKTKTEKNITISKGEQYKGIEQNDAVTLFDEAVDGETYFYKIGIQEVVKYFALVDCEVIVGDGKTNFRLKPEEYKGYNGTYCWNEAFNKYEGKILGIKQTIVYEGENLHELNINFQKAVACYLQETAI